jgi:hypothetical protein
MNIWDTLLKRMMEQSKVSKPRCIEMEEKTINNEQIWVKKDSK